MGILFFVFINVSAFVMATIGNVRSYLKERVCGTSHIFLLIAITVLGTPIVATFDPEFLTNCTASVWFAAPIAIFLFTMVVETVGFIGIASVICHVRENRGKSDERKHFA